MKIVHDKPEGAPIINIEGKKGESLFRRPVIWTVKGDFKRIKEQFESYKKLIEKPQDERLLALIGALSMEEALDLLLRAYVPGYCGLKEQFSLFFRMKLARSLRIIPAHILDAAVLINEVRNKFVHNLKISCFDALDNGTKNNLRQKYGVFFPDDTNTSLTVKDTFIHIVEAVIVGLGIYASHLKIAREYITSDDFHNELKKRVQGKAS